MIDTIKRLIKRWGALKALFNSQEYFLVTACQEGHIEPWRGPIKYEYIKNTDRELFYEFVHDYVENNLRPITGKFTCVRTYENREQDVFVMKGSDVIFDNGYMNAISNGNTFVHKVPTEEIFSHFKFVSK